MQINPEAAPLPVTIHLETIGLPSAINIESLLGRQKRMPASNRRVTRPRGERYDLDAVKQAAVGRWAEILAIAGVDANLLDRQHHPCPKCGGSDRFRALDDFTETGAVYCNQCFSAGNGDGLAALAWLTGWDFKRVLAKVAATVGIKSSSTKKGKKADPAEQLEFFKWNRIEPGLWCKQKKPIKVESLEQLGARYARYRNQFSVIAIPVWGPQLDAVEAVGWILYRSDGGTLPVYRKDAPVEWRKVLLTYGSEQGIVTSLETWKRLTATDCHSTIWKLEGSTDLLTAMSAEGWPANTGFFTTANGAKEKPLDWVVEALRGKTVRVCHDADQPGQQGATWVEQTSGRRRAGWCPELAKVAEDVRNVTLPFPVEPTSGPDIRDFFNGGGKVQTLLEAATSAEAWKAGEVATQQIVNFTGSDDDREPMNISEAIARAKELTGDFPRRVGDMLFTSEGKKVSWIKKTPQLFGFYHATVGSVEWRAGPGYVTKDEYFSELHRTATEHAAIEDMPHEPRIAGHYYTCGEVQPGDGSHLAQLLDRFSPATPLDRDLIQAALMTVGWGGPHGQRPCFIITSSAGRGAGKTTVAELVSRIWGGYMAFSPREDVNKMKTRILTSGSYGRRILLLDNVKSSRFSWSDFESLITAREISGHGMYVGESSRPNTFVWFITINGASVSKDIAQRSVVIKLDKPERSGSWLTETQGFIDKCGDKIVADIVAALRERRGELTSFSRWAEWERDVLSRLPEPADAQRVILERQAEIDADCEEVGELTRYFARQLEKLGYDPSREWVSLPSQLVNRWFNECQNERVTTTKSTQAIKQLIEEGQIVEMSYTTKPQRGFRWTPDHPSMSIAIDIEDRLKQQQEER